MNLKKVFLVTSAAALLALGWASDGADVGPNSTAQSAADVLKQFAASDGAFLAAGLIKPSFSKNNLASLLQYPTDPVEVLSLTGAQIRQAFERSLSFYPQPNNSFLQISGFEVVFKKNAAPNQRIVSITTSSGKLDDSARYTIAMPKLLAEGGEGYFKIWEHAKTVKTFGKTTVEDVLSGKPAVETSPRWSAQG